MSLGAFLERRHLYLLTESRSLNRFPAGWLASLTIVMALRGTQVVYVVQRREWCANDPPKCVHKALQGFPVAVSAVPTLHNEGAGEDAIIFILFSL